MALRSHLRAICATPVGKHVSRARFGVFFCCVCRDLR
jgi:hypothetical protein